MMSTSHPRFTARIEGSPETIFDLIPDMPNYGRWLPGSEAFVRSVSAQPISMRDPRVRGLGPSQVTTVRSTSPFITLCC